MNPFFMLPDEYAAQLYCKHARSLPIVDYHNHLSAAELAADKHYDNITQLWISADPYKHRAMRILGIPEHFITGEASDYEKFEHWYRALPRLAGNVLFDWSVMEWSQILGLELLPFSENVQEVWELANNALEHLPALRILDKFDIRYNAPCASLTDDLSTFCPDVGLCPSLRGDDYILPSPVFVRQLSLLTGISVSGLRDYEEAIMLRLQDFLLAGCCFSDHALDDGFRYLSEDGDNERRFLQLMRGEALTETDRIAFRSHMLRLAGAQYATHQLTMQLHIGARRSTSTRLRQVAGPVGGFAAMGNSTDLQSLITMLDELEQQPQGLPKILLFTLNPADNAMFSTLSGSFSKDGTEALISQGPAWWWCDHYQGIRNMLEHLSAYGILSTFSGMTTDSRSLLSFVRHDYFRRVLCGWLSEKVKNGSLPDDETILADIIRRICWENAAKLTHNHFKR